MKNSNIKRSFNRSLAAIAVGACLATAPMAFAASNTAGSIYGEAKAGATITFKSDATGLSRTITADENGKFSFKSVPTGRYTVKSSNGGTSTVLVTIGTGSSVIFSGDDTEIIQVRGSAISSIDTSSVESTMVFTQEQIELLPISRDAVSVALLTPGTVPGDQDFGNLPSFGGSSVAENGYYIDGFDVTNIRTFLNFSSVPFDAISQTQVKTGGYGAEYGRSLGGVTNIVTKSGTNEWKFGAAAYYAPNSLRTERQDVLDRSQTDGTRSVYGSDNISDSLTYNLSAGGPIIEDTLFVYTNLEFQDVERETFGSITSNTTSNTTPNGIVKLDWYITDDHIVSGTYIQNNSDLDVVTYDNVGEESYPGKHGTETSRYTQEDGGDIMIFNYTGHITDDFSVSLMYGELENKSENKNPRNPDPDAAVCALALDTFGTGWGGRTSVGCYNTAQSSIGALDAESDRDERVSYKIDLNYSIGDHDIRVGYNNEEFTSYTIGSSYSGGKYYRYLDVCEGCYSSTGINGVELPIGTQAVRVRTSNVDSGSFKVENTAFYIEDDWQISDDVLIYMGLRNETFTNYAANGDIFVEADSLVAPRLGFSWDVDGDSSKKFYGTLGRYYIPIAANSNIRSTRIESSSEYFYEVDGFDAATGEPINLGAEIGTGYLDEQVPDPRVIAVTDLKPMHQDELVLGYQQELADNWTGGVKFIYRKIQDGMDDMCAHDGFFKWAEDTGIPVATEANGWETPVGGFDVGSTSGCLLINPGRDIKVFMDINSDGAVTEQTVSNKYFDIQQYKRSYKGLELTLERAFSDGWYANMSYVFSKSEGNIEGYVNSTLGQEDAGATQDFDHKKFQDGSQGYLPNDRRHQFKVYGAYQVSDELTLTANMNIMSGTPLSCNGYLPTDDMLKGDGSTVYDEPNFKRYGASSFYCASDAGTPELSNRGDYGDTGWSYMVDAGFSYVPHWADDKLTLKVDVFNIFDVDKVTEYNQQKDKAQGSADINENFLAPTGFQSPRSVRFTARYKF